MHSYSILVFAGAASVQLSHVVAAKGQPRRRRLEHTEGYPACCVEHMFTETGEVHGTTCFGGRSPWEASTMSDLCTAGHSDAGAMAPPFRDCSQEAIDAGSCGTADWDTCAECADFGIPIGMYFANVGYTSCPDWVVAAAYEEAEQGGQCDPHFDTEDATSDECFDCRFCFDCEAYGTCDLSVEEKCWGEGAYPACEVLWQQCDWYYDFGDDCTPGFEVLECRDDGTVMHNDGCDSCDCEMDDITAATGGQYTCEPGTNTIYYDEDLDGNADEQWKFSECWYDDCSEDDDDDEDGHDHGHDHGDEDEDGDEDDDDDDDDDECDIATSSDVSSSPKGTTNHGAGSGWCLSNLNTHISCTASPADCWERCSDGYGDDLVAIDWWDGGSCYCQNDCECMDEVGDDDGYTVTRDSAVAALPVECGPTPDSPYRYVCAAPVNYNGDAEYDYDQAVSCDEAMAHFTSSDEHLAGKDFSSAFSCPAEAYQVKFVVNVVAAECCGTGASACWADYSHVCADPSSWTPSTVYLPDDGTTCDQIMDYYTQDGQALLNDDFSSVFDCGGKNVEVVETVNAVAEKCCGASGTSTCVSAPFVTGVLTLSGITAEAAEASKGVLRFAIADVAGVERDAVTIIGVASARRRRLQTGVVVDYVIETADNAASILAALDAAAADPSLVDTAIAAVDTASVFAGATTESITTAVAESAPPTPAPVSQATPSDGGGNGGADAASAGLIGGTVAGVAVIAAIAVGAYVYMRRAKDSADSAPMAEVEVLGTITGAVESGALKDAAPDPSAPPLMPPPPPTGRNFCSACGAPVQGPFCSACGARA